MPAPLRQQLNDPSPDIRAAAARHPNLPEELIHELWQQTRIPPQQQASRSAEATVSTIAHRLLGARVRRSVRR
jgi:hypothetical protein